MSDPMNVSSPPAHAIGFPSREAELDVLPGFRSPPPGYGEVPFFWWLGDPLTRERLTYQLDRLAGRKIMGLQINYAHSDKGGPNWGYTLPSDPPLFSQEWWDLVKWFMHECKQRGMAVSLSDYTLGIGQHSAMDEALKAYPEVIGAQLHHEIREVKGGTRMEWTLSHAPLMVRAYPAGGDAPSVSLMEQIRGSVLAWEAPAGEDWRVVAVWAQKVDPSLDPMHPLSGKAVIEKFFQPWEDRHPGEGGKGLNFFFSDELNFRVGGKLWNNAFAEEFRQRKGYDLLPELPLLFVDGGPRTPKVRMDYYDVVVVLSEINYFRPVFEWHQQRGMIYGCDHGGRGRWVTEFGDYFRTQRWNQGPGCDQPHLGRDLIKNKVAASIAHLYQRPRVWLEGFYGSGWGTSSAAITDATIANFLQGHNLLTLHGLYYSTHGGWWEWAPPCNHWRMPYWEHMGVFMDMAERLSYLLSQGTHVAQVAIVYPVAPSEADIDGQKSVDTAFAVCELFYRKGGRDSDFVDFESLDRATIHEGQLHVSGESYRVLVLPAMRAVRHSTLVKAHAFARQGGIVIAVGALPEASERTGRGDEEVQRLVTELFVAQGATGMVVQTPEEALAAVAAKVPPTFALASGVPTDFTQRRIGNRQVFALYGVPAGMRCTFRVKGKAQLWDAWTGQTRDLPIIAQDDDSTCLRLTGEPCELQIVVFGPGEPLRQTAAAEEQAMVVPVEGAWEIDLIPTLDNRFGDFRWPAFAGMIGAEARQFRYADEASGAAGWEAANFDDTRWPRVTYEYGTRFHQLGPIPADADVTALEAAMAAAAQVHAGDKQTLSGQSYAWQPYDFSWRSGVEGDTGHQGYHGLKEEMYAEFIRLGKLEGFHPAVTRVAHEGGTRHYLWTTVYATRAMTTFLLIGGLKPSAVWVNGKRLPTDATTVELVAGANPVLLRYESAGAGFFVVTEAGAAMPKELVTTGSLAMPWYGMKGILPFDVRPGEPEPAGWYRFKAPPGLVSLTVPTERPVRCWVNGDEIQGVADPRAVRFALSRPIRHEATVALRIEQERGEYGGAVLMSPITHQCGTGEVLAGDLAKVQGLATYSGGVRYRKEICLNAAQVEGKVVLDLGKVVASAQVLVNGQSVGVKVAPPWRWDISGLLRVGKNQLEVMVYNTLGNHYTTIPTHYRGDIESGLVGPVNLVCTGGWS